MKKKKENKPNKESKVSPLREEEIEKRLKSLSEWKLSSNKDKIFRKFGFDTFDDSISFLNQVADSCKKLDHNPATIVISSNKVKIEFTTEEIEELSEKDLKLAEEINFITDWKDNFRRWLTSPKVIIVLLVLFLLMLFLRYGL